MMTKDKLNTLRAVAPIADAASRGAGALLRAYRGFALHQMVVTRAAVDAAAPRPILAASVARVRRICVSGI